MSKSSRATPMSLDDLVRQARACIHCADVLPHPPRPILRAARRARVVLIGQAPGARVHESGVPWEDESGRHLGEWLGVTADELLDPELFAILPMGFCWPGRRKGGDLPPRPECAPLWHDRLLEALPDVRLKILIGRYAIARHLAGRDHRTLTETVAHFRDYLPEAIPLPHPSWRSRLWIAKHPWFSTDLLPELRRRIRSALERPA
jgi:uracil-DNA glycosylase